MAPFLVAEKSPPEKDATRPYWLARTLLDLGDLLEKRGRIDDARAAYQLLRLENGQFVPTPADARFQAGETLALRVPFVSDPPQVTFANRQPLALEREGAWYRTETVTLSSGQHDFVVAPPSTLTRSRLAAQAPPEAKAKAMANTAPTVLRIRIQVTP